VFAESKYLSDEQLVLVKCSGQLSIIHLEELFGYSFVDCTGQAVHFWDFDGTVI